MSLTVYVQPNAKKTEISGLHGGALKLRIMAPAVADQANEAVCGLLAKLAGIPERSVTLRSGHKSRYKIIRIDRTSTEIVAKLKQLGAIRNDSQT
ncbi:MAG: DUF167 domain-containing protein [Sulfuriferula sp.]